MSVFLHIFKALKRRTNGIEIAGVFVVFIALFSQTWTARADNFDRVLQQCVVNRDWANTECRFGTLTELNSQRPDSRYEQGIAALLSNPFWRAAAMGLNLGRSMRNAGALACEHCSHQDEGELKLQWTINALRTIVSAQRLSQCQSACLVLCASSNLLRFRRENESNYNSAAESVHIGTGNCFDFASVAERIGEGLGIDTRMNYGLSHEFVSFSLGGSRFYAEPQNGGCNFYSEL